MILLSTFWAKLYHLGLAEKPRLGTCYPGFFASGIHHADTPRTRPEPRCFWTKPFSGFWTAISWSISSATRKYRRFLKIGVPQVATNFNTKSWSSMTIGWFGVLSETCLPSVVALSSKTPRKFHIGHMSRHGATAQGWWKMMDPFAPKKMCKIAVFWGLWSCLRLLKSEWRIHGQNKHVCKIKMTQPIMMKTAGSKSWTIHGLFDTWPPKKSLESIKRRHTHHVMVLWCQLWPQLSFCVTRLYDEISKKNGFGIWIRFKPLSIKKPPSRKIGAWATYC